MEPGLIVYFVTTGLICWLGYKAGCMVGYRRGRRVEKLYPNLK